MRKILSVGLMAVMALALIALCLPSLFIFSVGEDGEMTWLNWFGIGWLLMLIVVFKKMSR